MIWLGDGAYKRICDKSPYVDVNLAHGLLTTDPVIPTAPARSGRIRLRSVVSEGSLFRSKSKG